MHAGWGRPLPRFPEFRCRSGYSRYSPFLRLQWHTGNMTLSLFVAVALAVGGLLGFFAGRGAAVRAGEAARSEQRFEAEQRLAEQRQAAALAEERRKAQERELQSLAAERLGLQRELALSQSAASAAQSSLAAAEAEGRARADHLHEIMDRLAIAEEVSAALQTELRLTGAHLEAARKQIEVEGGEQEKKLKLLADAEEKLGNQFKVLAAEIFREKSARFREESEASLGGLLNPLKERLGDFQLRVEALRDDGIRGREELKQQIGDLKDLNQQLSSEAGNLVRALKGSSKAQGDWGEFVLEQMLEKAGLRRDHEYRVQTSFTGAEGTRARPDVILNLPGGRHLVIDAKVSLVNYSAYCDCDPEILLDHVLGLPEVQAELLGHLLECVAMFQGDGIGVEPGQLEHAPVCFVWVGLADAARVRWWLGRRGDRSQARVGRRRRLRFVNLTHRTGALEIVIDAPSHVLGAQAENAAKLEQIDFRFLAQHLVGESEIQELLKFKERTLPALRGKKFIDFATPLRIQQLSARLGEVAWRRVHPAPQQLSQRIARLMPERQLLLPPDK